MKSGVTKGESFSPGVSVWRKGMAMAEGWDGAQSIKDRIDGGESKTERLVKIERDRMTKRERERETEE